MTPKEKIKKVNIDPNYINFGFGELKITARHLTLHTNISGLQCNYFLNGRGISSRDFMGHSNNEVVIKGYEVHKIYFK